MTKIDSPALEIGGMEVHIHVLCVLSKNTGPADLVKDIKTPTSK